MYTNYCCRFVCKSVLLVSTTSLFKFILNIPSNKFLKENCNIELKSLNGKTSVVVVGHEIISKMF